MVNDKWVMSWKALLDRRICCSLCSWMKWHDQICIWYRSSWPLWGERRPIVGKWVSYYSSSPFKDPNWGSRNRNWKVKSTTYWSNSSQQNRQVLSTVWARGVTVEGESRVNDRPYGLEYQGSGVTETGQDRTGLRGIWFTRRRTC